MECFLQIGKLTWKGFSLGIKTIPFQSFLNKLEKRVKSLDYTEQCNVSASRKTYKKRSQFRKKYKIIPVFLQLLRNIKKQVEEEIDCNYFRVIVLAFLLLKI